jgi:UDPglucose--hexose-1-phosphate uridylyltransferase
MSDIRPYYVYNALTGEWTPLVSPHRTARPWQGQRESITEAEMPEHDEKCYLCPGTTRNTGQKNPEYSKTYVFTNDFAALLPPAESEQEIPSSDSPLLQKRNEDGTCEVLCYSPLHNKTLTNMNLDEIVQVINLWRERYSELGKLSYINHVQIFESRGKEVGASNPHPHAQIWAQKHIPLLPQKELETQIKYQETYHKNLLIDYGKLELKRNQRIIQENDDFILLVPHWAMWPYETMILPKADRTGIDQLTKGEIKNLAAILSVITKKYSVLFRRPHYGAPYMMGIHQRPTDGKEHTSVQLHIHFEPPLLTPDRQKILAGYERLAQPQRDLTPEKAAETLRNV